MKKIHSASRTLPVAFVLTLLMVSTARAATATQTLHIIPYPKSVEWKQGGFAFDKSVYIVAANPADPDQRFAAEQIQQEALADAGLEIPIRKSLDKRGRGRAIVLGLPSRDLIAARLAKQHGVSPDDLKKPEGYVLSVGRQTILIAGADPDGLFWGAQTLKLMLRGDLEGATLPAVRIDDHPTFAFRGITDDVSRGPVPSMETIELNLRRLSELKINKFNFYIEHVFCYEKHPDIGPKGGCFTADELRHVQNYAKKYHIELIGGLQSFGHWEHILSIKKYSPLAESPLKPEVLSPAKSGTYALLDDMYSEIAPVFDSKLFNISCDETWGLGLGASRKMLQDMGIEGLYSYHINKLHELLSKHGKRIMMWADIALKHPGIIEKLPQDIIFLPWDYSAKSSYDSMLQPLVAARHEFIIAPGVSCWSRIFPDITTALLNIRQFALDGARYGAMGMLTTTWDDDGENLFAYNWYPLAFSAEAAWNPSTASVEAFQTRFAAAFYGDRAGDMNQAIDLIGKTYRSMEMEQLSDGAYLMWPPTLRLQNRSLALGESVKTIRDMDRALRLVDQARPNARHNAENIDFVAFAARRTQSLAHHKRNYVQCLSLYDAIQKTPTDADASQKFDNIDALLKGISDNTKTIFDEYRRLWALENRPYYFDINEKKYNDFIAKVEKTRTTVSAARENLIAGKPLPTTKELGLTLN